MKATRALDTYVVSARILYLEAAMVAADPPALDSEACEEKIKILKFDSSAVLISLSLT